MWLEVRHRARVLFRAGSAQTNTAPLCVGTTFAYGSRLSCYAASGAHDHQGILENDNDAFNRIALLSGVESGAS